MNIEIKPNEPHIIAVVICNMLFIRHPEFADLSLGLRSDGSIQVMKEGLKRMSERDGAVALHTGDSITINF